MSINKIEIWVHDHILKNDRIRHVLYGVYQRALYVISPKIKYEGDIETITPNDGYEYLFGYYDKCPWSDDGKYILALRVKNASEEADSTKPADIIRIDLATKKTEKLATTHTWNVQQGCMMQWLSNSKIIFNDIRNNKYCSVILDINTQEERLLGKPIYTLSSDKKTALSLDFSRLHRLRPGYGYANISDETKNEKCPDSTCIWKIDIESGKIIPILKYTDFANFEPKETMKDAEHKVNHLMISPDGKRFMVLHRWFNDKTKYTRLVTCNIDGTEMYNLSDDDFVSHCCWKNNKEIISYLNKKNGGKGYYLLEDKTQKYQRCWKQLEMDGHPSYSYDGKYVVTDTYPNRKRIQSIYIMSSNRVKTIARVFSPFKYRQNTRCDLHPRWSKDGKQICIDASFSGRRSICLLNSLPKYEENKIITNCNESIKFSTILPVYNSRDTIERCIESIINQTYKKWELIIIDDGSTDDSLKICKKYSSKDSRIKVHSQKNMGPGIARNNGIKFSKGDFISFLDSDDYYENDYFETINQIIRNNNSDIVFYDMILENSGGDTIRVNKVSKYENETKQNLLKLQTMGILPWSSSCKVIRSSIAKTAHFSNTDVGEESIFSFEVLNNANIISFTDSILYHYVDSATGQHTKGGLDPWRNVAKTMKEYLDNNNRLNHLTKAVNGLAFRALSIAIYRTSNNKMTFFKKYKTIRAYIKKYKKQFDIYNVEYKLFDRNSKIILQLIKMHLYILLIIASKVRRGAR